MASADSQTLWRHDVFVSFCGKDTYKIFVCHLYKELEERRMNRFPEDEDRERGTYLDDEILKAIEDSKIAIVVLSRNYTSSTFCLQELAKIMECRKNGSLFVKPLFYNIDRSEVRKISGSLQAELDKQGQEDASKVQSWNEALTQLAEIKGDSTDDWEDDAHLLKHVMKHVAMELDRGLFGDCN